MNVINIKITLNPNLNRNKYISDHMSWINFNVLKKGNLPRIIDRNAFFIWAKPSPLMLFEVSSTNTTGTPLSRLSMTTTLEIRVEKNIKANNSCFLLSSVVYCIYVFEFFRKPLFYFIFRCNDEKWSPWNTDRWGLGGKVSQISL